jgi:hypothetical protein
MSEADRVFPRHDERGAQSSSTEKRLILSAPRRGSLGAGKSRVVEVVHVRRGMSEPKEARPRPTHWGVRAATWPEGFSAKSAPPLPPPDIHPIVPAPQEPTVHVMPMWEPSPPPQPVPSAVEPAPPPLGVAIVEPRKPRATKPKSLKATERRFADPFADDDKGANCIRCGYLVELGREKQGLMTCSKCG